ncbi:unnamed protein product [Symbiodinium sp. CCMP2592]|nr:unnamed protein product [Symbiodinium sp. CCMP2592]
MGKKHGKAKQIVPKSKDDKPGSPPAAFAVEAPKPTLNKRGSKRKGKALATQVAKPPQEATSGRSESIDDIFSKAKSKTAAAAQPEGGSKRRAQTGDGQKQREVKKPKRGSLEDPFGRSSDWTDDGLGGIYNQEGWEKAVARLSVHSLTSDPSVISQAATKTDRPRISSVLELSTLASGVAISAMVSDGKCGPPDGAQYEGCWPDRWQTHFRISLEGEPARSNSSLVDSSFLTVLCTWDTGAEIASTAWGHTTLQMVPRIMVSGRGPMELRSKSSVQKKRLAGSYVT